MAALYANENFPLAVVQSLRQLGHAAVTVQETSRVGQPMSDPEVLAFAASRQWAVLTLNRRHFVRLYEQVGHEHAGIIVCTFDPNFANQAQRIHSAIEAESPLAGKLIRVNRPQA
jgi:hypothetical protein